MSLLNIVFSKDRPLQLHGYLTSLRLNGLGDLSVIALVDRMTPEYQEVSRECPWVQFVAEVGGFGGSLRKLISETHYDYMFFGVDDGVWVNKFDADWCVQQLATYPTIFGVSLRLGGPHIWRSHDYPVESHHGYVFEVVSMVYRMDTVREVMGLPVTFDVPNDVEVTGLRHFCTSSHVLRSTGAQCVVCQEVNRVQDKFPNYVSSGYWTADQCLEEFRAGKRLAWCHLQGRQWEDPFIGEKYFKVA